MKRRDTAAWSARESMRCGVLKVAVPGGGACASDLSGATVIGLSVNNNVLLNKYKCLFPNVSENNFSYDLPTSHCSYQEKLINVRVPQNPAVAAAQTTMTSG